MPTKSIKRKEKPHIKLTNGRWYAFSGKFKLLLVPAIGWCNEKNTKEKRKLSSPLLKDIL